MCKNCKNDIIQLLPLRFILIKNMKLTPINPHFNACDQKWELMPEQDGGRLCDSCERVLVDFTPFTEQEVLNQQRANDFKLCGRYTRGQVDRLHRHLTLEETQNNRPWLVSLAMGLGSLLPLGAAAQNTVVHVDDIELTTDSSTLQHTNVMVGKMKPKTLENELVVVDTIKVPIANTVPMPGVPGDISYPLISAAPTEIELKGTVVDKNTGDTLFGVYIQVDGTQMITSTDFDGNFSIIVPANSENVTLIASYIGYKQDSTEVDLATAVKATETLNLELELEMREIIMMGVIKPTAGQKLRRWSNPANWYRAIRNRIRYKYAHLYYKGKQHETHPNKPTL